jgi:hypothetical protein
MNTSKQRPLVNNPQYNSAKASLNLTFIRAPLPNGHFFRSQWWWPLYTGLTVPGKWLNIMINILLLQQSIEDVGYDVANVGDFAYMTGQLIQVIEDKSFLSEVVKLVYSTSIEMESSQLPQVTLTII